MINYSGHDMLYPSDRHRNKSIHGGTGAGHMLDIGFRVSVCVCESVSDTGPDSINT